MTPLEIMTEARRYITLKTKWRHIGRTEKAVDCAGLILRVGWHFDIPLKDVTENYRRHPDGEKFVEHIKRELILTEPVLLPGRVVVIREAHLPCHIGIIGERYGQKTLIHASAERGKVWEESWNQYWQARFRAAFDYPGVER